MSCVLWKYVTLAKINCYFLAKTVRVGVVFPGGLVTPRSCCPGSHEWQLPALLVYLADAKILLGLCRLAAEGFHRFKCGHEEVDAALSGLYYVRTSKWASEECCVLREGGWGVTPSFALHPARLFQLQVQTALNILIKRTYFLQEHVCNEEKGKEATCAAENT